MRLGRDSSLKEAALCVARALSHRGIRSVLTGGACASIYSGGRYESADLDFILQAAVSQQELDDAMNEAGFRRRGDQYFHPRSRFFVEFPPGPLGIGDDLRVRPVEYKIGGARLLVLSPTDCCRDRLAAFYHWNDRQSLKAAVQVAARHAIDLERVRRWSTDEGFSSGLKEFVEELARARRPRRTRPGKRR